MPDSALTVPKKVYDVKTMMIPGVGRQVPVGDSAAVQCLNDELGSDTVSVQPGRDNGSHRVQFGIIRTH